MPKYSESIMQRLRQRLDLEEDDTSKDDIICAWSKGKILENLLIWEGIIGFDYLIKSWVEEIWRVNLHG